MFRAPNPSSGSIIWLYLASDDKPLLVLQHAGVKPFWVWIWRLQTGNIFQVPGSTGAECFIEPLWPVRHINRHRSSGNSSSAYLEQGCGVRFSKDKILRVAVWIGFRGPWFVLRPFHKKKEKKIFWFYLTAVHKSHKDKMWENLCKCRLL